VSSLLVLEDALLERRDELPGKLLPDELDPLFLVAAGRKLGGDAATVAELVWTELGGDEQFAPFLPAAIHEELCRRRGYKGQLFEGLLLEEVQSAVKFHAESLRQLKAAGLGDVSGANEWERPRTLYTARDGIFQLFADGNPCWITPRSQTAKRFDKPVQSKVARLLLPAPEGRRRVAPELKAHGWRAPADNLLRDLDWTDTSRKVRKERELDGPKPEHHAHLWKDTDDGQFSQCKRCGVWRYFSTFISVYRYATGDRAQAELAVTTGKGRLRSPPRCTVKEGT
jgi:hypothetical protein